jgi:hypothetical protein
MSKFVLLARKNKFLEMIIKTAFRIIFFCISAWNYVSGILRMHNICSYKYSNLKKYKGKYDGKRCFIIATGPSLTIADLEKLTDEYTFGMNSMVNAYDKTDFRPTFYGIQDVAVYENLKSVILQHYKDEENVMLADRITWHFNTPRKWNVFPLNMSYNAFDKWFKNDFHAKFSDNALRIVYDGFSITYSLIEIAVYMGFKEIYLLGADCSFDLGKPLHFEEYGVVDKTIDTARERGIAGYMEAKKYMDKHDVKIFNATRGGALEVFERVNLDNVLTS